MNPASSFFTGLLVGAAAAGGTAAWICNKRNFRLGRFFSHAAHEINTPLTAINITVVNLLSGVFGPVPPDQLKWVEMMSDQLTRLNGMVGELRDLIHIVLSRDLHVQLESLAPGDLLEAALPAARRAAAEAKYELKIEKEDGLPRVRADRDRAARTLASLFFHARKFRTDSGLSVRASRRGERVIFEVSYHGQPLPHDEARRSLELLYPAVGPKQHTLTAVGLGLGILRAVSEGQGGGLDFHVEPGGNARLTMALPAADR